MTQIAARQPQTLVSPILATKGPFLALDRDFPKNFNTHACFVHHNLTNHPLLTMPRILELARWLPAKYVRINSGNVKVSATPAEIPSTGLTLEQSFERIEQSDTRIMLKKIELHSEYRELLYTCLRELEDLGHPCTRGIWAREGYIFISAPNMTTPYHMDPEVNFLLQTRGRKTFHVLPGNDRSILSEQDFELFYSGRHKSLNFNRDAKPRSFDMGPGDGVHIPVNHPHWVTTGNEVTVSFAVTFQTKETKRRGTVYAANHYLRSWGLEPTPFGQSSVRDFFKNYTYRFLSSIKSWLPRRQKHDHH
jgi:hypothetical protein